MPGEVKQRKKKQSDHVAADPANKQDEDTKVKRERVGTPPKTSTLDLKFLMCLLSLAVCAALSWMLLQQNARFSQMEEKFALLYRKTSSLSLIEEQVERVTQKLAASEDDLQAVLSAVSSESGLRRDVSALHVAVATLQSEDSSASGDLQAANARFLNVTETWQERLAAAASSELASLKAESREAHAGATERVNEAERRTRSLAEKLEELEDSTRRNARAMERAEEDDAKRAQAQLDWNTQQIHKMDQNIHRLARQEAELSTQLQEHLPRAKECEEQLPYVEESLRSIVKLGADLSGAERRIEEVTLQVFSAEDNMLKSLNRILAMRQEMDALQARGTILKMKSELAVVREAVHELTMVLRGEQATEEEEEEEEPDEEWEEPDETPQEDVAQ